MCFRKIDPSWSTINKNKGQGVLKWNPVGHQREAKEDTCSSEVTESLLTQIRFEPIGSDNDQITIYILIYVCVCVCVAICTNFTVANKLEFSNMYKIWLNLFFCLISIPTQCFYLERLNNKKKRANLLFVWPYKCLHVEGRGYYLS